MLSLPHIPTILAQGQLAWMEPLVGLGNKLQSGAAWVAILIVVVFLGAPATALLAGSRSGSWYRRAPYLWLMPVAAGLAMLPSVNVDNIGWGTLTVLPYMLWAVVASLVGILHGGFQVIRFLYKPRIEMPTWDIALRKVVYGLGAVLSGGVLLLGALIDSQPFFGLFGAGVVAIGAVILATKHSEAEDRWSHANRGDRLWRAATAVALAVMTPPTVAFVVLLIGSFVQHSTPPGTIGLVVTAIPVALTAAAAYAFRLSGEASKRPRPS